jgi:dTDP-4-amino-4,6-dideoxygalactose transaminase
MAEQYGDLNERFPVANLITTNSFFLGTFAGLTDNKLKYIEVVVKDFFKGLK